MSHGSILGSIGYRYPSNDHFSSVDFPYIDIVYSIILSLENVMTFYDFIIYSKPSL